MLIKAKDDPAQDIALLENLLQRADLPADKRAAIEAELARLRSGLRGERDVAYYLDFEFRQDPDWAVIHDLRLVVKGRAAQIDHVLINRWLEIYVLESKAFRHGLKVSRDGQFMFWNAQKRKYQPIPSPVAQARRHQRVLDELIQAEIWPRLRRPLPPPRYFPLVLVAPTSRLIWEDGVPDEVRKAVMLADAFADDLRRYTRKWLQPGKGGRAPLLTSGQLEALARRIVRYHQPARVDYYERFRLPRRPKKARATREATASYGRARPKAAAATTPAPAAEAAASAASPQPEATSGRRYFCAKCGKTISRRVAMFCFQHKERFGGRAYCLDCQKSFPPR